MQKNRLSRLVKTTLIAVGIALAAVVLLEGVAKPVWKAAAERAQVKAEAQRKIAKREANAVPRLARPAHPDRPTVALIDFTIDRDSYLRQRSAATFAELVRVGLTTDHSFIWLDRADFQRVRNELELSETMSYGSSAEAMQLGQWLNAHLIITGRFVDTAGPQQRLVIEVIETLTADRLAQRVVPFPHDLRSLQSLPDAIVHETQRAVGEALAEAQDILLRHQGSTVVSLISIANMTNDRRMDPLPARLKAKITTSAEAVSGLRIVQVQNPDPAMDEQDLSLTGLTSRSPDAWRTAADVYVWGTVRDPMLGTQPAASTMSRLDPTKAKVRLTFNVWNGFDDPQEITLDGTRDQIDSLADRLADQIWTAVQQPLPDKLDLNRRAAVARTFSLGTSFRISSSDGPESDAAKQLNQNIQARQAAWFFNPASFSAAESTVFFTPRTHPDRVLSGQLAHIHALDRVIYRFDWQAGRRNLNKPTLDRLDRLAGKSIKARQELADLIIPSRKSRHQNLMSPRSTLPADMPLAARTALHDENLRGLTRLGHLLAEKLPTEERDRSRGMFWMEPGDVLSIIVDMPGGTPTRVVEAWEAWWPLLRDEWGEELSKDPDDRRLLTVRRERRLATAYEAIGRSEALAALLNGEALAVAAGENAERVRPIDLDKAHARLEAHLAREKYSPPRPPALPKPPAPPTAPATVDAPVFSARSLQLRMLHNTKNLAAGVLMSYRASGYRVHQLQDLGGQALVIATGQRSQLYSSRTQMTKPRGVFALMAPEHLQLKHLSFPGLNDASVTGAAVVGDDLWVSTDSAGLHKIRMSSGHIEPVRITGELQPQQIFHIAGTPSAVMLADENGKASVLQPDGEGAWRARDLKWRGSGQEKIRAIETSGSMLLIKSDRIVQLLDLESDRVIDLRELVAEHEKASGRPPISDAVFDQNDVVLIANQKLYRLTEIESAKPRLALMTGGIFRYTEDRLALDGDRLWVTMAKTYPIEEAWHYSPLLYDNRAGREEASRTTVALWDIKQKRWSGQFHVDGEVTHIQTLGKWLLLAADNGLRDLLWVDRAAVLAEMGYAPTPPALASIDLAPGFGGTDDVSAVMREAATGDTESLQRRIAAGESIDEATGDGWTPLMSAVLSGQYDAVRKLLEAGANPNQINRGTLRNTPATLAAALDRPDLLGLLIDHGLSVDDYANLWANPACAAVLHRSHGALRWLAEHHARFNYWLKTVPGRNMWWHSPLFMAISRGDVSTVELLLELGASPSHANGPETYTTPVQYALGLDRDDIAQRLIEAGADLNEVSSFGSPALNFALPNFGSKSRSIPVPDLIDLMLDRGADSTRAPEFVYWALKNLDADVAHRLIEADNDIGRVMPEDTIRGLDGPQYISGPFTYAVALAEHHDSESFTARLDNNTINLELRVGDHRHGDLLATTFAGRGHYALALRLAELGYRVDLRGSNGNTPLHVAARSRQASLARLLLSLGGNPFIRNEGGESAIDLASEQDFKDLLVRESLYAPTPTRP